MWRIGLEEENAAFLRLLLNLLEHTTINIKPLFISNPFFFPDIAPSPKHLKSDFFDLVSWCKRSMFLAT